MWGVSSRVYAPNCLSLVLFFFFNDTATTEIYTLSLHDALPIFHRDPGSPADRRLDLVRAPPQHRHVGRTEPRLVGTDLNAADRGLCDQELKDALDGPVGAGAEVVDLAHAPALEQGPVAAHDVANIGEIAGGLEVTRGHHGFAQTRLDLGDLLREVRGGKGFASPGPGVVERARTDDVEPVALVVLVAHQVLRHLADRIR